MEENKQLHSRQARKETAVAEESSEKKKKQRKPKVRLIPIWIRLLLISILFVLSLVLGLMVGYGVIGSGEVSDALKTSTWERLVDLVKSGTQ